MEAEQQVTPSPEYKEISGCCYLAPEVRITFLTKQPAGGRLVNEIQAVRQRDLDRTGYTAWISYQQMELRNEGVKETRKIGPGKSFVTVNAFIKYDKANKRILPI